MNTFLPLRKGNACPVCESHDGRCRDVEGLILCMTLTDRAEIPGWRFIGRTKNQTWGKWVQDNSLTWVQDQREQLRLTRQRRAEGEAQRRAEAMPAGERDKHYRQLLDQLTLHPTDRADLLRRGITNEQIERWGIKSVEQWQILITELPYSLPGVSLDERSLSNYHSGYLVPIESPAGEITGFQIANRVRREDIPRYPWLSSATKKRPNGPTPHLPNGELPLAVAFPTKTVRPGFIGLCEGTGVKPRLAAEIAGFPVIGASGANFQSSPKLLKEYLEVIGGPGQVTCIFFPDAGAIDNKNILRQYRATWELLQRWGYQVEIFWWGQVDKHNHSDIDELQTLDGVETLTVRQFNNLIDQANSITAKLKQLLSRASKQLTPPKPFTPRQSDEVLEYEPGGRLAAWRSLTAHHKFVLDQSSTGGGKSHDVGTATPEDFEAKQIFYITDQVRNPTTWTLSDENGWKGVEGRHGGLKLDDAGKLRVAKPGDDLDIPGNCSRTQAIAALRSKNIFGADTDAACITCPSQKACKHFVGEGYGFKYQRRVALPQVKLRIHPASLPESDYNLSEVMMVVDEPGANLETSRVVEVRDRDIDQLAAHLILKNPELCNQVQPILATVKALLGHKSRYGIKFSDIKQLLSPLPEVSIEALWAALQPDLSVLEAPDEVVIPDLNISTIKAKYQHDRNELKRQETLELSSMLLGKVDKKAIREEFKARRQGLKTAFNQQVKKLKAEHRNELKRADRLIRKLTAQSSNEAREKIENSVLKQWLPEFLGLLQGARGYAHIQHGRLILTLPDDRLVNTLKATKGGIFLDATLSQEDLALKLGCKPSEIMVVRQERSEVHNLKLTQIADLGRMGQQRGDDQKRRLSALTTHYKAIDSETKVIDFKRFEDEADGIWWRDSRGVNDFLETKTLILVGTPCQNLNALMAEYAVLTGNDDLESEGFKAYVDRKIRADIQQAIGRLRAHRRLDEQLQVILITDFDLEIPNVEQVKASSITLEAAGKFERFQLAATRAIAHLKEVGEKVTQTAVSALCGYSQQYISRYWKLLQTLLRFSNSVCSKNSGPPPDVGERSEIEVVASVLETVTAELPTSDLAESIEDIFFQTIPTAEWGALLAKLSDRAKASVLESLLSSLPPWMLKEVEWIT